MMEIEGRYEFFFDIAATLELIRYEKYPGSILQDPITTFLPFDYTRLPMWLIGMAYRMLRKPIDFKELPNFPSYPTDHSADILFFMVHGKPSILWPDQKRYAVVFTHDVDTGWIFNTPDGREWLEAFASAEERCGIRSAWYCVPCSMKTVQSEKGLNRLAQMGHEIGVHGLTHDANLPKLSLKQLQEKLTCAKEMMAPYSIEGEMGYRAPWLSRSETIYQALSASEYLYDTSSPNADCLRNNSESNNGCCTFFPFRREDLIVLPVTVPQDAMRVNLGMSPEQFWDWILNLVSKVKEVGGIAVVSTHIQPHHSANHPMLDGYRHVVSILSNDSQAWVTLPKEAAQWAQKSSAI